VGLCRLDTLIDLIAMYGDVRWCGDADAHLVTPDVKNDDLYVIANSDGFADVAGKDEHDEYSCTDWNELLTA
jgi:hypothetical protein